MLIEKEGVKTLGGNFIKGRNNAEIIRNYT
jgi:hypothetical protein